MPAEKTARASLRKRAQNRLSRGAAKTAVRKAESLVSGGDVAQGQAAVVQAASALDRAARKGTLHPNSAARQKSRLARKANQARKAASP